MKPIDSIDFEVKEQLFARKRLRDRKYLDALQGIDCLICGKVNQDSVCGHHLVAGCNRGFAYKSPDCFVIPLCYKCHNEVHEIGDEKFFDKWDSEIDIREFAYYFYKEWKRRNK